MSAPRLIIVAGVSGVGKSTIAAALAQRLGVEFVEGDALHPQSNVTKMAAGVPLNDEDRAPWLETIGAHLCSARSHGKSLVITCSALKKSYRDILRAHAGGALDFVLLDAPQDAVAERLKHREGHFMPQSLLASQYATLERPAAGEHLLVVDAMKPVDAAVDEIARALR